MRKKLFKTRFLAMGLATAMVLSMVNVPAVANWQSPMASVQAAEAESGRTLLYESATTVDTGETNVEFVEEEANWTNKKELKYSETNNDNITVPANYTLSADVTLDDTGYTSLAEEGDYLKVQGVTKLGSSWSYITSSDIKQLSQSDFSEGKTAHIDIAFTEIEPEQLMEIDFVLIGKGFEGKISVSNVKVTCEGEKELDYGSLTPAFENVSFDATKGWDEAKGEYNTGVSLEAVPKEGAVVNATVMIKADTAPAFSGGLQFKGAMRLGADWNFVASKDYNYTSAENFTAVEGHAGWYAADVAWSFGAKVDAWYGNFEGDTDFAKAVTENLAAFTVQCAGSESDFSGDIYIVNAKFTDGTVLVEQEDKVIADFSQDPADTWAGEPGYIYHHGKADGTDSEKADVSWDSENERLGVSVDFSAEAANVTYSEAKVGGSFDPVDISNYNQVTFDLICPEGSTMSKIKFFMNDDNGKTVKDTNAEFTVDENGKAKIAIDFSPKSTTVSALTIGLVGPSIGNGNKGTYYIDNVTFAQSKKDPLEGFVKITEAVAADSSLADITNMPTEVKLVDNDATQEARALAAYLTGLRESNQVLFGHQNSSFRSVNSNGETSDIKDITGDEAGVFGIDSLSLTGAEVSVNTTPTDAIAKSVEVSKKAYDAGSIVTLSCHMPNFADTVTIKESTREDKAKYPYDFMACNFNESKDLRTCSSLVIQEGTEANKRFKAYLDIIADYANALAGENVPVLFRPFHENSGGWFWWGTTSTSVDEYKAMWKYMVNYLKNEKGVHNFLYVYSPNGPITSEDKYLERYPGDAYVDVLAFDYYDDYADVKAAKENTFFANVAATCKVVKTLADKKKKIPAIAESGIRITGAGKDSLVATGNPPVLTQREDNGWYDTLIETAVENDIPYFLLWANFDDQNFFLPYKISATDDEGNAYGHEMINYFIKAYNNPKSIFAKGTNFYDGAAKKVVSASDDKYGAEVDGYLVAPNDKVVIKAENLDTMKTFKAVAYNAAKVEFEVYGEGDAKITLEASAVANSDVYTAELSAENLEALGTTGVGKVYAYATGKGDNSEKVLIGKAEYINFNQDTPVLEQPLFDNFEYYYGNSGLLQAQYGDDNSAAGCDSSVSLDENNKVEGEYGLKLDYRLTYTGDEVWTGGLGRQFDEDKTDYSEWNAITMWVKPDGNGQKLVFQLLGGGAEAEAFLTEFGRGTEAKYVTIPFSAFIKKGSTDPIDPANITAFKLWCNSIPGNYRGEKDENGSYVVDSSIYFDDIKAVTVSADILAKADEDTSLIVTSKPIAECEAADVEVLPDYSARDAVEAAIKEIGEVSYTKECKAAIDAAKQAYEKLDASLKSQISKELVEVLTNAEASYKKLETATKAIEAIKDVKYDDASKALIEAARKAYDALTAEQKKQISADVLKKLTDAEKTYVQKKEEAAKQATEADKKAAADVAAVIDAIKDVQYNDASKAAIEAARKAYNALTDTQKALVPAATVKKLTDAEKVYQDKKAEVETVGKEIQDTKAKAKFVVTKFANGVGEVAYKGTTNKKATKITVPNTVTMDGITYKVTSIAANAFKGNKKITKVTMGSNIVSIGANAFSGCSKLATVTIGKNVTTIGNRAFYKCSSMTKITIPSKVTSIGKEAFSGCKKLKTVSVGKNVKSIGEKAFYKCSSMTKITIPSKVTSIGKEAFSGCKKLKTITIKTKKLTSKTVAKKAFKGVPSKVTVKVPKSKLKPYKKLLKSKGLSSKAKIKK